MASFAFWYTKENIVLRLSDGFYPEIIHIDVGESITFINLSSQPSWPAAGSHPTHSSYPEFDPLQGIDPQESWTFTFAQEGAFTFHDHFAPQFTGIVISGTDDISLVTDQAVCNDITDPQQQGACIEIYFRNIAETASYAQARAIYEDVAVRYPNSCHGFAHDLGKNAYRAYTEGTLPEIGQEASSCAYGLWHGFTTAMQSDQGFGATKDFCSSFTGATPELQNINRINCYHGIGIGLIPDPPPAHQWGDFQKVTSPALDYCDTITGDPLYTERCLTGVFHAMTDYMVNESNGFSYDAQSLGHCKEVKEEHEYACLITLASGIHLVANNDLTYAAEILQTYSPSQDLFLELFLNASVMFIDTKSTLEEMGAYIATCEEIFVDLRTPCMLAVINNLSANGMPGMEYVKTLEFCAGPWIQSTERTACFTNAIIYAGKMYTPEKMANICTQIPHEVRMNIPECST